EAAANGAETPKARSTQPTSSAAATPQPAASKTTPGVPAVAAIGQSTTGKASTCGSSTRPSAETGTTNYASSPSRGHRCRPSCFGGVNVNGSKPVVTSSESTRSGERHDHRRRPSDDRHPDPHPHHDARPGGHRKGSRSRELGTGHAGAGGRRAARRRRARSEERRVGKAGRYGQQSQAEEESEGCDGKKK